MTTDGRYDVFISSSKTKELDCPITSCKLLKPGCKEPLDSTNVGIQSHFPWHVKNLNAKEAAWDLKLCY